MHYFYFKWLTKNVGKLLIYFNDISDYNLCENHEDFKVEITTFCSQTDKNNNFFNNIKLKKYYQ